MDIDKIDAIYPLSSMQKGILFYIIQNGQTLYFQQNVLRVQGCVCLDALEESLNLLLKSYDVLRAVILYEELDEPIHVILKERKAKVAFVDISSSLNKDQELSEIIRRDKERAFDLSKDILFRLIVIKHDDHTYDIIISYHHIIIDGWSATILVSKLFNFYYDIIKGKTPIFQPGPSFGTYINKTKMQENKHLSYWINYLSGYDGQTEFNTSIDIDEKAVTCYETIVIDEEQQKKLAALSARCKVTINVLIKSIFSILFQRYLLTEDIVFGEIVSGRNDLIENMENMVGFFINMLPVRVTAAHGMSFYEMMKNIQLDAMNSYQHMHISLSDIQKKCFNGQPLIKLFYNYSNHPKSIDLDETDVNMSIGFNVENVDITGEDNYDFCITVMPMEKYSITIRYNSSKYDQCFVKSIFDHFITVLNQTYNDEYIKINEITLQDNNEEKRLFEKTDVTDDTLLEASQFKLYDILRISAARNPNKDSLFYLGQSISYSNLEERANAFAQMLKMDGVNQGDVVGVFMPKCFDFVAAMFAIFRIGGIFMPLDISTPTERLQYMIDDSGASIIMTNYKNTMSLQRCRFLICNSQYKIITNQNDVMNDNETGSYLLYTSGTTDRPKSVMLSSFNIIHYSHVFMKEFNLTEKDVVLSQSSIGFDVFIEEVFPALISGASVVFVDRDIQLDINLIQQEIESHGVTIISCSPRYLQILNQIELNSVRLFISGGEVLNKSYCNNLLKEKTVYNTYGPTETSICATYHQCSESDNENIPIGKPLPNYKLRILDQYGNVQPRYVKGEIYIGGVGVSMGYYRHEDLTNKKFVTIKNECGLFFKTDDIGYWTHNDEVQFIDRCDRLVKVRGYRIELSEVERTILQVQGVKDAYVTVIENIDAKSKYLCAFVVGKGIIKETIIDYIKKQLPYYMIPQKICMVEYIRITVNGKVNHDEMLALINNYEDELSHHTWNQTEKKLLEVWSDILKIPQESIGPNDSFFEIGGDSILMIKLNSIINDLFPGRISIGDFFVYHNISELASYLDRVDNNGQLDKSALYLPDHSCETKMDVYRSTFPRIHLHLYQSLFPKIECMDIYVLLCSLAIINVKREKQISLYNMTAGNVSCFTIPVSWNKDMEIENILIKIMDTRRKGSEGITIADLKSEIAIYIGESVNYSAIIDLEKHFDMITYFENIHENIAIQCECCHDCLSESFVDEYISSIAKISEQLEQSWIKRMKT